jgi:VanZ like family
MAFTAPRSGAMNRSALIRVLPALALMGVIFSLSAQPAGGDHAWWVIVVRKFGHVTGYALLTGAWWYALRDVVERPVTWAVCISFAYACSDEFHQTFVRGREGAPRDVLIDAIGMALAVIVIRARRPSPADRGRTGARGVPRSSPAQSP